MTRASRPSVSDRGYGPAHRRLRRAWAKQIATGDIVCARCGQQIAPTDSWDLGHDDRDRTQYSGPEHAACNRATMSHRPPRRRPTEPHPGTITQEER